MPAALQAHQDIVLDTREPSQMEQQRKVLQVRARLQQQAYGPAARLDTCGCWELVQAVSFAATSVTPMRVLQVRGRCNSRM